MEIALVAINLALLLAAAAVQFLGISEISALDGPLLAPGITIPVLAVFRQLSFVFPDVALVCADVTVVPLDPVLPVLRRSRNGESRGRGESRDERKDDG